MSTRVPDVIVPAVCIHMLAAMPPYEAFAGYLVSVLLQNYRENCTLLVDRRNPMLRQYLERFSAEENYQYEYIDFEELSIIGRADMYVLFTTAGDDASLQRLRTYRANGIRTVVILQ